MTVKIPKMFDFHLIDNIIILDYYELSPSSPVTLTITLKITLTIIIAHHSITPLITCARMFVGILSLSITLLYYYYIQIFFFIWNFFFYVWTWMKSWIWICILISWLSVGILVLTTYKFRKYQPSCWLDKFWSIPRLTLLYKLFLCLCEYVGICSKYH